MIRRRALAHALWMLSTCGGLVLAQAPPALPPGLEDLAGRWTNASSPSITALEIKVAGSTASLHVWASCGASDCDWGEVQAEVYWASEPDACCAPALSAVFARDDAESRVILSPRHPGDLTVGILTRFREDASRNSIAQVSLLREGSPTEQGKPSAASLPVRVGGRIKEPKKVKNVDPRYPSDALRNRIQGVVVVKCTIDRKGRVSDTQVLQGPVELIEAAITAVRQWRYTPTLLDGVAVPVIMTVTVSFRLR